ncbi:DUF2203 domain-containing protein [Candidatus Nitrosocosmicus franklandus]|uniref:DUF2203 domain-containing protein n=1 Tax=Candidatus Nitrosocosmicus franklandianus TaxID=1798806 RepID=A0A484IDK4_9ARCH|nr:DUF2203 domain-containing protein [Candidatus Nitrosocosmicus franklandus]VFJ15466.1 conserved protein of unknown function [Candidatus Nitrosocosmicus franklandus]
MFDFFTPARANSILPQVRSKLVGILNQREKVLELQSELSLAIEENIGHEKFFRIKNQLNKSITEMYQQIEEIEKMGIIIKSFEEGLIDFAAKRFDEEVWLCWKLGEDKIRFWHRKDEGFIGRKPLSIKGTFDEDDLEDLR